jgi:hypothetical protein
METTALSVTSCLRNLSISNERSTFARSNFCEPWNSALEELLIFLRGRKLLAEFRHGVRQVGGRHGHIAPLRLLIHQLLKMIIFIAPSRMSASMLWETRCARARRGRS